VGLGARSASPTPNMCTLALPAAVKATVGGGAVEERQHNAASAGSGRNNWLYAWYAWSGGAFARSKTIQRRFGIARRHGSRGAFLRSVHCRRRIRLPWIRVARVELGVAAAGARACRTNGSGPFQSPSRELHSIFSGCEQLRLNEYTTFIGFFSVGAFCPLCRCRQSS
jgi:hypothetical protein